VNTTPYGQRDFIIIVVVVVVSLSWCFVSWALVIREDSFVAIQATMAEHEGPNRDDSDESIPWKLQDARLHPSPRRALIHVPSSYAHEPTPLIIALHGKGQHPSEFEYHTQLSNEETNQRAIVIYPEGINVRKLWRSATAHED